jgi:two-component system phosphate regulon response regulator PhoB
MVKPFSLPELLARIRAILRRTSPTIGGRVIRISGVEMDIDNGGVKRDGIEIRLSLIEFKILRYLMENAGKVRTREQIRNAVWGRDSQIEIRAVDVRITRLRRRLNIDTRPDVIRTVRSVGYALGDQQPRGRPDLRPDGAES